MDFTTVGSRTTKSAQPWDIGLQMPGTNEVDYQTLREMPTTSLESLVDKLGEIPDWPGATFEPGPDAAAM